MSECLQGSEECRVCCAVGGGGHMKKIEGVLAGGTKETRVSRE